MKQGNCLYHDLGIADHMGIGCTCPATPISKIEITFMLILICVIGWGVHHILNLPPSQYDCLRHDCTINYGDGI
jgi:hypothetical protein